MTKKEIIEKKIALVQNDIDHYNRRLDELVNEQGVLKKKMHLLQQRIGKKHTYRNLLERDIENLEDES